MKRLRRLSPAALKRVERLRQIKAHQNWRRYHAKRQNGICALCHRPMGDDVTLDHIVPLAAGGADTFENTQAAHEGCNQAKGSAIEAAE
jgi:5-methylcytosine-specific restriction endonuclease McrA